MALTKKTKFVATGDNWAVSYRSTAAGGEYKIQAGPDYPIEYFIANDDSYDANNPDTPDDRGDASGGDFGMVVPRMTEEEPGFVKIEDLANGDVVYTRTYKGGNGLEGYHTT